MSEGPSFELEAADSEDLPDIDSVVSDLEAAGTDSFFEASSDDGESQVEEDFDINEVVDTDGIEIDENGETSAIVEDDEVVAEEDEPDEGEEEPEPVAAKSSSDYAEILAKKQALVAKEHELTQRSTQENDKIAELEAKLAELAGNQGKKPRSPSEALAMFGFDYETATKEQLGAYEMPEAEPEMTAAELKIQELEEKLNGVLTSNEQKAEEDQQRQYTQAKAQMLSEITKAAEAGGHEYIAHIGEPAIEYVNQVLVAYYNKHGQMLDIDVACGIVEKEYADDLLGKIAKSPKFQKQFQSSNSKETPSSKKSEKTPPSKQGTKTLKRSTAVRSQVTPSMDELSPAKAKEQMAKMLLFHDD